MIGRKEYDIYTKVIKPCLARLEQHKLCRGNPIKIIFKSAYLVEYVFADGSRFFLNYKGGCASIGMSEIKYSDENYTIDIDHDDSSTANWFRITKNGQTVTLFKVYENGIIELGSQVSVSADHKLLDIAGVAGKDNKVNFCNTDGDVCGAIKVQ